MTLPQTLDAFGLALQFVGAGLTASGVWMNESTATALATPKWDLNPELKAALLKQSRRAVFGLFVLALGTVLQGVAIFAA
jgi:hypothetical protein